MRPDRWLYRLLLAGVTCVCAATCGPPCALAAHGSPQPGYVRRIVEVRYIGLTHLTPRDLESILSFSPGDIWRDDLAESAKNAVLGYYAKRGFYRTKVAVYPANPEAKNLTLVLRVDEGPPCLIRSIWLDDPPGFKSKHVMLRFKDRMSDIVRTVPGERYDEQVLGDRLRELREWLVAENYILANTDPVRLKYNGTRTAVDVVLAIDYGDRVTFGFQGNTVLTKGELNDLIAQVRATGLGKDYVGVIQRRFVDEYRSRAYHQVRVDARAGETANFKHVTFAFKEGVRTELSEVKWEGLSEPNIAIAREVFQRGASRLVQRGYFVEKDVDKALLLVLEDLKSRGFLSSKLIAKGAQPVKSPPPTQRVRVTVQIAEGEQTQVGKIALEGFSHVPGDQIAQTLGLVEGQLFNPFALEEGLQRLRAIYVSEGYLEFRILTDEDEIVAFTENNRSANIRLRSNEGTRIRIGAIQIKGLQKTRQYVVERELEVHPNDWWLGPNVQDTETNLRKLGIFSEVRISAVQSPQGPGYRDLVIELSEAEPGVIEAGPGFRSDLGVRSFARVSYNNILGKNWIASLGAEGNRRVNNDYRFVEYNFDATFVEPRFFGTRFLSTLGVSTKKQRFPPEFNEVTTQGFASLEHKILKKVTAKAAYKLERIRQFDVFFENQLLADDNRSLLIGSFVPSLTLDTRDNPFTTTSGWLVTGSLEYAHPHLSGQAIADSGASAYQKWIGSVHRYTPVTKDIIWSNVVAGGFARSSIAGREIPLIKLFRLGGYGTIRGFQEDSINVDKLKIFGTLTYLNLRTQVDFPLVGDIKLAPFLDAGNLYIDALRSTPFFRTGAGVGIHYTTPVGPINLDWGYKLNPTPGEAPNQFHFSVGLI